LTFFPICIPFMYFFCIISLAKNLSTILNKSGESRQPCLVPDSIKWCQFSPFSTMLAVGLSYVAFVMLRYIPSILSFSGILS
jgi:hypothetical protein